MSRPTGIAADLLHHHPQCQDASQPLERYPIDPITPSPDKVPTPD